jgi:adenylate cyclase
LHGFSEEDLVFYTAIAGQLGIALENARLYQEVSEQADDLRVAVARLEGLDSMKTQFMQNASHELRTPLALILGYTECLVDDESESMPSCTRDMLKVVQRQAKNLSRVVEDIALTWQNESQPMELEPVVLQDVVHSSVLHFHPAAEERDLKLEFSVRRSVPTVQGTHEFLRRVVDNLLSNAIKFTPSGGQVLVRLLTKADDVVLQVSDTGIGIAPEQHERIFDRFYQVDGSRTRHYEGMGLGLALAKEIVEACDGTVSVESELGRGSTFTVRLPIWSESVHDAVSCTATSHTVNLTGANTPDTVLRTMPQATGVPAAQVA